MYNAEALFLTRRSLQTTPNGGDTEQETEEEIEYYNASGNKNSPHANQKAKQAAQAQYNQLMAEYNSMSSKPNKTPDDKNKIEQLKRALKRLKEKMDFKGETHSRTAKGN